MVKHEPTVKVVDQVAFGSLIHHLREGKENLERMTGHPAHFCVLTLPQYEQLREEVYELYATNEGIDQFCVERIHNMELRVYVGEVSWQ